MAGMFGALKNLSTQNSQSPRQGAEATSQQIREKQPLGVATVPLEAAKEYIPPSTTPLPGNANQMVRDKRTASDSSDLQASQQTRKPANLQAGMPANPQESKPVSQQTSKPANLHTSKPTKKFTSYLTEESIRALKRLALDEDKKDYEVLQEAVDAFLLKKNSSAQ